MAKSLKGLGVEQIMARVRNGMKSGVKGIGYWAAIDWLRKHRPEQTADLFKDGAFAPDTGGKRNG